jgi:hypothetical protein
MRFGLLLLLACSVEGLTKQFPAGWNGLAERPPLAWRSYNAQVQGMVLNQQVLEGNIDALTSKNRTVDGVPTSLWDLGYRTVGIDGGYETCINNTMHDEAGNPMINTELFPDMKGFVDYGHAKHIKMGWYQNACGCGEPNLKRNFEGDIKMLFELGFDGAKYDRCGDMLNSTLYASLMNDTGKSFLIENCHVSHEFSSSFCPTCQKALSD